MDHANLPSQTPSTGGSVPTLVEGTFPGESPKVHGKINCKPSTEFKLRTFYHRVPMHCNKIY